jgi:hypothetical protein
VLQYIHALLNLRTSDHEQVPGAHGNRMLYFDKCLLCDVEKCISDKQTALMKQADQLFNEGGKAALVHQFSCMSLLL